MNWKSVHTQDQLIEMHINISDNNIEFIFSFIQHALIHQQSKKNNIPPKKQKQQWNKLILLWSFNYKSQQ